MDLSDGEAKETVFAFKFKEEADAEKFEKLLKEHAGAGEDKEEKKDAKEAENWVAKRVLWRDSQRWVYSFFHFVHSLI